MRELGTAQEEIKVKNFVVYNDGGYEALFETEAEAVADVQRLSSLGILGVWADARPYLSDRTISKIYKNLDGIRQCPVGLCGHCEDLLMSAQSQLEDLYSPLTVS